MDDSRFDRLARSVAHNVSRRWVLQGLGLGMLGALGLARPGSGAPATKVEICHFDAGVGTRIWLPQPAVAGHLRHGDVAATPFGTPCIAFQPPDPVAACGATCEGPGGGGESDGFLGCVPDGQVCGEFTTCCNGCAEPGEGLLSRCGGCIGENSGFCTADEDCCSGLVCDLNSILSTCVAA